MTSIASPAIAICTRFSATLSTCAFTTAPGCSTTPEAAPPGACAAVAGSAGLTVRAILRELGFEPKR